MDLFLVYVHEIGSDYKEKTYYEFIFSDTLEGIDGEEWDSYPANGNPSPPNDSFIKQVGKIYTEVKLIVAQNNEQFSMWDCVDGIIPLAWQNIDGLDEYPEKRLIFPFGMKFKDVESRLYENDIIVNYEKNKKI